MENDLALSLRSLLSSTCLSAALLVSSGGVQANPLDGVVSSGAANIVASGSTLNITQTSSKAIIDWRGFDIAAGETTSFHQPSSSAMTLNRVNSGSASIIDGTLTANGTIFIINQNGVLFGAGSRVDVNSLVATTANISNANFMAGNLTFDQPGNPNAVIENRGIITAQDAGLVGLVAPNVINSGVITAKLGRVHLASGDTATVDLYGDGLMQVAVSDAVGGQLVENTGSINAAGGTIALTAAAGSQMVNSLVHVSGELRAPAVGIHHGKIIIAAEGSTAVSGNVAANKGKKQGHSTVIVENAILDVSGRNAGEQGGSITITGDNVALMAGSFIDASGYQGLADTTANGALSDIRLGAAGGDIQIGGDYLGRGVTPTAQNLYVDPGVLILNDALYAGDAGRTIFWSDATTQFYGNVYARALGGLPVDPITWHAMNDLALPVNQRRRGMGGFVETSGHGHLDVGGYVDLTSSSGDRGTYFLDPTDITIYGNVDPAFVSTDGAINLATNLKLWLDASDTANVNLTYNSLGTTASGTSGTNTLTVSANTGLTIGARIRLGGAGAVTAASNLGVDTYTISNIAGTTITLSSNLTSTYAASGVYQGYVSQLTDKSGNGSNATQATAANMPLWIASTASLNGMSSILFQAAPQTYLDLNVGFNTTAGNYNTVINLMNWSGNNSQMPYGFNSYDIWSTGGAIGFNTGASDVRGINSAPFVNTWTQLTSVFYNGTTANGSIYVNSAPQSISCLVGGGWMHKRNTKYFYQYEDKWMEKRCLRFRWQSERVYRLQHLPFYQLT